MRRERRIGEGGVGRTALVLGALLVVGWLLLLPLAVLFVEAFANGASAFAAAVTENAGYLTELDSAIGDLTKKYDKFWLFHRLQAAGVTDTVTAKGWSAWIVTGSPPGPVARAPTARPRRTSRRSARVPARRESTVPATNPRPGSTAPTGWVSR